VGGNVLTVEPVLGAATCPPPPSKQNILTNRKQPKILTLSFIIITIRNMGKITKKLISFKITLYGFFEKGVGHVGGGQNK
jgi:hypothetical protein